MSAYPSVSEGKSPSAQLIERLDYISEQLSSITARVRNLGDRLIGPEPEKTKSEGPGLASIPNSFLHEIRGKLSHADELLGELSLQIRRVEDGF